MTRSVFAAAAFVTLAVPALAGSVTMDALAPTLSGDTVMKRAVIKFDDLNPADAKDAATLYERLSHAAMALCTSNPGGKTGIIADKAEQCRINTLKKAISAVDTAALKAVAAAK